MKCVQVDTVDTIIAKELDVVIVLLQDKLDTEDFSVDQWLKVVLTRAKNSLYICYNDPIIITGGPSDEMQVRELYNF